MMDQWEVEFNAILSEFKEIVKLSKRHCLVIGCSTSEIIGKKIGTQGSEEVASLLFRQLQSEVEAELAFQCCEHLNRALVVERATAERLQLEEVSVVPVRTAGGAMATYAYHKMKDPVVVEFIKADAGIDIGSTFIGMHLKHVAVPVRVTQKTVGDAFVTLATTRPKLIGGVRAVYEKRKENESC
ncbi:TIGR01440 family protein [Bacillus sp. B15-48]|uniref:TIGR01440 family protein n=1 Tax=Bacillus sp. B15-48 TaxID=1548601 RepID=UPI00193FE464|nr:TIGR01440 family protein [Bacillus sp. B15-48]MBM4761541.1 TIGR01440 family protein [Bacillus sp. B15-48]